MVEVKDNIRPGLGEGWIKVGAAGCEKYGLENIGWGMMVKRKFER